MADNWFNNVFLPSLFARARNKSLWLSRKQTEICVQNMEKHSRRNMVDGIQYWNQVYYTCIWAGRSVCLDYSKLNGCGTIQFGQTEAEAEAGRKASEAEQLAIKLERIARYKLKRPDRVSAEIAELSDKISRANTEMLEELEDGENVTSVRQYIAELETELNLWK